MLLRAGAERIILYEPFRVRAAVVRDIVAGNDCADKVKIVEQDLTDQPKPGRVQLENPADMLILDVSSYFGSDLLNSNLIPTITHARDRGFLAKGVKVIPARVHLVVCLVESETISEMEEVRQSVEGCDISEFNKFSRDRRRIQLSSLPHRKLSQPARCLVVDLQKIARGEQGSSEEGSGGSASGRSGGTSAGPSGNKVNLMFQTQGTLHALVYWYEIEMTGVISLSLCLFLSRCVLLCLSLSVSVCLSLSILSLSLSPSLSLSHSLSLFLNLSLSARLSLSLLQSLSIKHQPE